MRHKSMGANNAVVQYSPVDNVGEVEAKINSRTDAQYVWNSDFKTIERRVIVADDTGNSSSDLSVSKGNVVVTSAPL